ncbi:hypothetical protein [Halalkalicoccus sp. NIPERK01]|uniref:hypothetical protein n=1 Tax=Halalkalicoccus sp. NIPERK01 TaxID=3053469 RepID=UPI00256F5F3A|nr:hypothetical protein [Halalkalicoccus sp. NIPERK01]MDL5362503.1 hypothetical protein [Halalkalicoccus sp. NIPERK01]
MLSLGTVVGLGVVVGVHTVIASVLIRFFRLRLDTRGGMVVFSLFLVPIVLALSLLFFGQLPVFGAIDRQTVLLVTILMPLLLGFAIDLFWMPSPEEVELARRG